MGSALRTDRCTKAARQCVPFRIEIDDLCPFADNKDAKQGSKDMFNDGETPQFSGKAVAHLAGDSADKRMGKTGRILMTIDMANEYKFTEDDGSLPADYFTGLDHTFNSIYTQFCQGHYICMLKAIPK